MVLPKCRLLPAVQMWTSRGAALEWTVILRSMANGSQGDSSQQPAPSAPAADQSGDRTSGGRAAPSYSAQNPNIARQSGSPADEQSPPYNEAPPPYQAAMSSPAPYPGAAPYYPTGSAPPGYPKYSPQHRQQCPAYCSMDDIGATPHPPPPPPPPIRRVVAVRYGCICPNCSTGVIVKETDACILICLILLAIITFPLGLFFLCCLPCAFKYRCSNCNFYF